MNLFSQWTEMEVWQEDMLARNSIKRQKKSSLLPKAGVPGSDHLLQALLGVDAYGQPMSIGT
jgi:hypothetical protein